MAVEAGAGLDVHEFAEGMLDAKAKVRNDWSHNDGTSEMRHSHTQPSKHQ